MKKIEVFGRTVLSCVLTFLAAVLYWPMVIVCNLITLPAQIVIINILNKRFDVETSKFNLECESVADFAEQLSYVTDDKLVAFESAAISDMLYNTNENGEPSVLKCCLWNLVRVYGDILNTIWDW